MGCVQSAMIHVKGLIQYYDSWGSQHQKGGKMAITFSSTFVRIRSTVTFSIVAVTFYSTSLYNKLVVPFLFRSQKKWQPLGTKQGAGRSFYFQHHLGFIKIHWWATCCDGRAYFATDFLNFQKLLLNRLSASFTNWERLFLWFLCWADLSLHVPFQCIWIPLFLCRKARHLTTPWSKCDVLIWAQPVSSDKTFGAWMVKKSGGRAGSQAPKSVSSA